MVKTNAFSYFCFGVYGLNRFIVLLQASQTVFEKTNRLDFNPFLALVC